MTRVLLLGAAGRMGCAVQSAARAVPGVEVAAGVDSRPAEGYSLPMFRSLSACTIPADVLVEFSSPQAVAEALPICMERGLPCVLCTTGLPSALQVDIRRASAHIPVFQSTNMSVGIAVLARAARLAAEALGCWCDIEIIEKHHKGKQDAPSGTALQLARAVSEVSPRAFLFGRGPASGPRGREIGIHSVRGGGIVGEHDVLFCCGNETLTFAHTALSREVFAQGALTAACWLAQKANGLYTMEDMLDDIQESKKTS
ncbi:MAG: 4-hydroxy-tetrahydrodipicolinate reductase [Ruthenibacterium sp.]